MLNPCMLNQFSRPSGQIIKPVQKSRSPFDRAVHHLLHPQALVPKSQPRTQQVAEDQRPRERLLKVSATQSVVENDVQVKKTQEGLRQ